MGSSKEPGTQWTSTNEVATPRSANAPTAPSTSFFEMASLKRAAITAKRAVAGTEPPGLDVCGARPAMANASRRAGARSHSWNTPLFRYSDARDSSVGEGGEEMAHLF